MKNFIQGAVLLAIAYFIFIYNDTDEFQSIMKFIFGSASYSPTENWVEDRELFLSGIIILLLFYYQSVWRSYGKLIEVYRNSPLTSTKPSLSAQQASYLYLQNNSLNLSTWLVELCLSGVLTLHYKKGVDPWSISRNSWKLPASESDKKLLDIMFKNEEIKAIKDFSYDPDPQFEQVSKTLYKKIKKDNQHLLQKKNSSFIAWLLVILFICELPFINTLYPDSPGLVAIGIMLSLSTGFAVYAICYQLPSFYNNKKASAYLLISIAIIITGVFHWGGLDIYDSVPWFPTYIFVEIMVVIAVAVYAIPQLPDSIYLLSQVVGYQKYLQETKNPLKEDDIPWIIGLDTISVFSSIQVDFKDNTLPEWLKSEEHDVKKLMQIFHETFTTSVNSAINGKNKSSSFSHGDHSSMGKKY